MNQLPNPRVVGQRLLMTFLIVLSMGHTRQRQSIAPLSAQWPFGWEETPPAEGYARFKVTVERGTVVRSETIGDPSLELAALGRAVLLQWKFDPTLSTTFETTFRHSREGRTGCNNDFTQVVLAQLPSLVEVISKKYITICDSGIESVELHEPVSKFIGRIRCDCQPT